MTSARVCCRIETSASTQAPVIKGVDFVTLPARDIDASRHFYGTVLGLPIVSTSTVWSA